MRGWFRSRWFAPTRLSRSALVDTVKSVYIPYWTFDAKVHCRWDAEAGYYYYVTVHDRDSQGKAITRQERRVRWEPASGEIDHVFDDEPIPGDTRHPGSISCARSSRSRPPICCLVRHRVSLRACRGALPGRAE